MKYHLFPDSIQNTHNISSMNARCRLFKGCKLARFDDWRWRRNVLFPVNKPLPHKRSYGNAKIGIFYLTPLFYSTKIYNFIATFVFERNQSERKTTSQVFAGIFRSKGNKRTRKTPGRQVGSNHSIWIKFYLMVRDKRISASSFIKGKSTIWYLMFSE